MPEQYVADKLREIENIKFEAQLLVAGFVDGAPIICAINEEPDAGSLIRFDRNFAAIGSGAAVAITSLYRRQHLATETSLMKGLYHVYEAIVLSLGLSPGVGQELMSIDVLAPNIEPRSLSDQGYAYLSRRFSDFGPREITTRNRFAFKDGYLEKYELDWTGESK